MTKLATLLRTALLMTLAGVVVGCGATPVAPPTATSTVASPSAVAASPIASASPSPVASPQPPNGQPPRLYLTVSEANVAFARKDFAGALRLYRAAANDDSRLEASAAHPVAPGPELRAFARFRIVVTDALVGQEDDARTTLEEARQRDATTPFLGLGLLFWDSYGMTADPRTACRQVTQQVKEEPEPVLRSLNRWGNPSAELLPDDVCRIPD